MRSLVKFIVVLFFSTFSKDTEAQEWNSDLSPSQKIYTLSRIWKDVGENFAFFENVPELNWDSVYQKYIPIALATKTKFEFYRTLERFICSLKDGHTRLSSLRELFSPYYKRFTFNSGSIVFRPSHINRRVFIMRVGSKEMSQVIPIGTEIVMVNELPVSEYLSRNVFPYISASTEHALWDNAVPEMFSGVIGIPDIPNWDVQFKRPDGTFFTMKLTLSDGIENAWYPVINQVKNVEFQWLENEIAYLSINTFGLDTVSTIFKNLLSELKKAKGVIIDLRRNGGGNSNIAGNILSYFTNNDTLYGSKWKTRVSNAYYKASGYFARSKKSLTDSETKALSFYTNKSWQEGGQMKYANKTSERDRLLVPLVVLTGYQTASAAEDFLIMAAQLKDRVTTIGRRTNGSTGQPLFVDLSTGGRYQVCTKNDTYPDGKRFVGIGIIPSIEIEPSTKDIIEGNDVILKKAIEVIMQKF